MNTGTIEILNSECTENKLIQRLVNDCLSELPQQNNFAVLLMPTGTVGEILKNQDKNFSCAAVPCGVKTEGFEKTVTFSTDDFAAEIVALNLQQQADNKSFELMAGSVMGRIFIDNNKEISMNAVLISAAGLLAAGFGLHEIITSINGILKK